MKPTKDDIRRRLGLREVPKPPEDLARRIKAEIPSSFRYREHVSAGAKVNGATSASWGLSWQVAASFLGLTITGVGIYMVTYEMHKAETPAASIAEAVGERSREFEPPASPASDSVARASEAPVAQKLRSEPRSNFAFDIASAPSEPPPPPPRQDADSSMASGVEGGVEGGVLGGVIGGVAPEPASETDDYRAQGKRDEEQLARSKDKGYAEEKESVRAPAPAAVVMAESGGRDAKDESARAKVMAQTAAAKPAEVAAGETASGYSRGSPLDENAPAQPLRIGGDVKAPVVIKRVEIVYPEAAKKAQFQGIVIIEAVIDRDGNVKTARVLKPLPMGLDEAAITAVKQWKFKPATLNGKPVDVIFNLTVNAKIGK